MASRRTCLWWKSSGDISGKLVGLSAANEGAVSFFSSKYVVILAVISLICFASELRVGPESAILEPGKLVSLSLRCKIVESAGAGNTRAFDNPSQPLFTKPILH